MTESVTIDEKWRLVLPKEVRRRAGIKPKSKLLVEVKGPGIIELRDSEVLFRRVQQIAARKLTGWREDEHREEKLLFRLAEESSDASS